MLFTTTEAIIALLTGQTMQHLCNISTSVTSAPLLLTITMYLFFTYCTVLTVTQYITPSGTRSIEKCNIKTKEM